MANIKDKYSYFFFFSVLFFTLRSYYFYSISLAPGPIIGVVFLLLMFIFNKNSRVSKEELSLLSILIFIFSYSIINTIISGEPYLNSVIGLLINIIIFYSIIANKDLIYDRLHVLNYVFLIHIVFFLIQFFAYYLFNEKIDFLQPITGEVQRVSGFERIANDGGLAIFRPSGLFSEPSSYCVFIITLLWIAKKSGKLNEVIEILTLITITLSFSLSGIAFVICYFVFNYYKSINIKGVLLLLLLFSVSIFCFSDYIISYYNYRVVNLASDNSSNERLLMFTLFSSLDYYTQLFGSGVGNDIIDIPLTTIPSLLVYLGVIGTSFFLIYISFLFKYYKVDFTSLLFMIIITFNFYKISNPYVWFILSLLVIVNKVRYERKWDL